MQIVKKVLVLFVALFLGTNFAYAKCKDPKQLRFSIIPTEESSFELDLYRPVLKKLKANTGKKIEFYMPTSYASVAEALIGGFVDVAVLGPYGYITAKKKDKSIEVFATYAKKKFFMQKEGPGYESVLITKKVVICTQYGQMEVKIKLISIQLNGLWNVRKMEQVKYYYALLIRMVQILVWI